jgi:hypothetical protein
MYLGGSIMTFALPFGAFIATAIALYFLFRADHASPRLKYLTPAHTASVATREPHPAPAPSPSVRAAGPETEVRETQVLPGALLPETAAPETAAPETAAPETAAPETAAPETDGGEA